jgi:insertion element IS1 protein InsB
MECKNCKCSDCIKKGIRKDRQKYYCRTCNKYFQSTYSYKLCTTEDEKLIARLTKEGMSICGISRITGISKANVINKIKLISSKIKKPIFSKTEQEYEVDEMYTYVGNKDTSCYIIYALNRLTRKVVDFIVGGRTKESISKIINQVKEINPKCIYTDKLNVYPALMDTTKHITTKYKINRIEQMKLNLRTHLKTLIT